MGTAFATVVHDPGALLEEHFEAAAAEMNPSSPAAPSA